MTAKPNSAKVNHPRQSRGARAEANRGAIRMETLKRIPWIEFLAAGISKSPGMKTGWVTLIASHSGLVKNSLQRCNQATNEVWRLVRSERARTINHILRELDHDSKSPRPRFQSEPPADFSVLARDYFTGLFSDASFEPHALTIPETLMISWGDKPKFTSGPNTEVSRLNCFHFAVISDLIEFISGPLRLQFGAGWFTQSDIFHECLGSTSNGKPEYRGMVTAAAAKTRLSPPEVAALATARLIGFGWLPINWNSRIAMVGDAAADPLSKKARALRTLFDQGLRIFEVPRLEFQNMTSLNVADSSDLADVMDLHFTSGNPTDRVLLAIEFTGYGKRGAENVQTELMPPADEGELKMGKYFLFRLPLGAVSVIQTLLPLVRTTIISYSDAASATGRSAILERMVRHYNANPKATGLRDQIVQEIRSLTYWSLPRHAVELSGVDGEGCGTQFDLTRQIEQWQPDNITDGSNSPSFENEPGQDIVQTIISRAESSGSMTPPSTSDASDLMDNLFPVGSKTVASKSGNPSNVKSLKSQKELATRDQKVRKNADELNRLPLTRKAHFRPVTLFRNYLKFLHGAKQLKLHVPEFLQVWIGSLFRFVWVMPLEPMGPLHTTANPRPRNGSQDSQIGTIDDPTETVYRSTYAGSPLAPQIYPLLFLPASCERACLVDLEPLLRFVQRGIDENDDETGSSWLANRISATNDLMNELGKKIGYCADFEPIDALGRSDSSNSLQNLLASLASETILSCIIRQEGGSEFLRDWSHDLMQQVYALLSEPPEAGQKGTKAAGNGKHGGIPTGKSKVLQDSGLKSSTEQLGIFEDPCGIATAALDCCRNHLAAKMASDRKGKTASLTVYFATDRLKRHFRPRISLKSFSTFGYHDELASDEHVAESIRSTNELANIDDLLIKCFNAPLFDRVAGLALQLVESWHQEEGEARGEFPNDLLDGIATEMFNGPPSRDFIEKRDAILKAFHGS